MNPEQLVLEDLSKNFEYFKIASEIDSIEDIEDVKNVAKCYFKLYLKQQEIISKF